MSKKRRPLLQRAAWHAIKTLVKKHPRAALTAAGSGASYAVKEVAADGSDAVKDMAGSVKEALTPERKTPVRSEAPSDAERKSFLASLSKADQGRLAGIARRR
ncbi:hypothetical protein GCM10007276_30330 [Agaricicola taiwanensis]|uniref:Uncharacterized protein n=1 Tax=Agaricicola taiwanensis TaxID=591372 RepID=A0A8J2YKT7_9RHOB|nr:hypothetical protein [Agaricicola taiwanensis]GGE51208.1 hypothetical protein GCM10007276_30330 [Agaricicola taiwanensis]